MSHLQTDIEMKTSTMKRVLMIAYHFPPIQGSSGVHRTVQFARHLPSFGWAPIIVAPHPRAYPSTGDDSWVRLPEEAIVKRAFAMDSARHSAIKGRYLDFTAMPDRWVSWVPGGVYTCLKLIRKYKPDVMWSTYPIASAHLIGLIVSRLTGVPWIADFRDPMVQEHQPASALNRKLHRYLEGKIVQHAARCVFVTRSALADFRGRYPGKETDTWHLIENGYDEALFEPYADVIATPPKKESGEAIKILHSGILYSEGRDPFPFLKAVKSVVDKNGAVIEVVFRGSGNEEKIANQIKTLGLEKYVQLLPSVPYDVAIKEMIESDALAVFQGSVFNKQIPAKIYEYLRAGRPILTLTDPDGETANMLNEWDGVYIADMGSEEGIEKTINKLHRDQKQGRTIVRHSADVQKLSRYSGTEKLNTLLSQTMETYRG